MAAPTTLSFFAFVPKCPILNSFFDSWIGSSKWQLKLLCSEGNACVFGPSGATGQIQSTEVSLFGNMKSLMNRFYPHVIMHDLPFNLQENGSIVSVSVEIADI